MSGRLKPEDVIRDEIRALKGYHVPDASGFIKLDAMENPYRLPDAVREKVAARVRDAEINRYPDAGASRVKERVREMLGVGTDISIVLGNGSDEIIQMLILAVARPGAVVMSVEPSFVMFRMISVFCGSKFVAVPLREDFELDADRMVAALREHKPALVFLAYPNNPTGNLFSDESIERVLEAAPGLVVIDEAYHAFAGRTYADRLGKQPNLLVMRTLSKSGLAGLRLGFVAGPSQWLDHVDKLRLPYNVGVLTQLVAEEVLEHEKLLTEQAAAIKVERTRLYDALSAMNGITPFPSEANFILFRTAAADAAHAGLRERGILVKNLNGSHPAVSNCLRVTVGTPEENGRFLSALKESL